MELSVIDIRRDQNIWLNKMHNNICNITYTQKIMKKIGLRVDAEDFYM